MYVQQLIEYSPIALQYITQREISMNSKQKVIRVNIRLGNCVLHYQVPPKWSVNKLKCLLDEENPKLKFDCFQLKMGDKLLKGAHRLYQIQPNADTIQLEIVNVSSHVKFEQYYKETMGKFLEQSCYDKQPIFEDSVKTTAENIFFSDLLGKNQDEQNMYGEMDMENMEFPKMLIFFKVMFIFFFVFMLFKKGYKYQIVFICAIYLFYLLIDYYSNRQIPPVPSNQQKNQQNQPSKQTISQDSSTQQQPESQKNMPATLINRMKAQTLLTLFKIMEIVVVFILTLFPNWDIQTHRRINANIIQRMRRKVNSFSPGTFEEIKVQ